MYPTSIFMNALHHYEHLHLTPLNWPPISSLSTDIQSLHSYVISSSSSSFSSPCGRAGYNTAKVLKSGWESQWLPSCSLSLPPFLALLSDEASCHVVSCPREKPTWQESRGGWQPSAVKELRFSVQYPGKNQILPTTMQVILEVDPFSFQLWEDCRLSQYL